MPQSALKPRPVVEPPAPWRFPVPQRHQLDNGVTVLLHHLPGQHVATVICHLGIPASAEPEGCEGIAAVMAASLFAGTQGITARRLELEAAAAGITWKASAGWTGPAITLELPAAHLAGALDLLRLALAGPAFQPAEVTAQIQLAAARLTQAAASPQTRVKQELPAAIYGTGGRAGRPAEGSPATVAHLAPEDIAGFHWEQVRPAAVTIVIAGDLDGLDAAALASEVFTTWKDDRPASRWTPAPEPFPRMQPAAVLVNQPGAVQTQLLLAAPVPGRGLPDWTELQVAAHILGAPITGHLDARLREDAGHSYGLRAGLTELVPGTGLLLAGGAVAADATISALTDIMDILTTPLRDPFDPGEHGTAAEAVTRMMPLNYETPAEIASTTAGLAVCGLPADFPDIVLDDIAVLTYQHVTNAYRSHVSPDRLVLIAAGDAAALAGPLQELAGPARLQIIDS
jgi:predicted Zn-dependent peptidase